MAAKPGDRHDARIPGSAPIAAAPVRRKSSMFRFLIGVVSHTPPWVWAILVALVVLGLKQLRDHVVSRARLIAQPLALGVLSLLAATSAFGLQWLPLAGWAAGVMLGIALNRPLALPRQVQALAGDRWAIGGSWAPLALLMLIFWLRYAVAASLAVSPGLANIGLFVLASGLLYGSTTGLFVARALRVLQQRAQPALATAAAW